MHPGPDPMGGPGFASRRPNAPSLPIFELPPPSSAAAPKYSYATVAVTQGTQPPGSLTSVGNLLTPPSTVAGDGTSGLPSSSLPPYSTNSGYAWSPAHHAVQSYAFQGAPNPQQYAPPQQRGQYSPLNTLLRGTTSPATTEGHMSSSYELSLPPFSTSSAMSAPANMATMGAQQQHPRHQQHSQMMHTPVSTSAPEPSPVLAQDGFRPPPTPTYYSQQPPNPQHSPFPFSSGPSPPQPSPMSAGPMSGRAQMSPATAVPTPPLSAPPVQSPRYGQQPFPPYTAHGPVLSNLSNPSGQPMLIGGLPHGMIPGGFNSGHAANMPMYGAPHSSQSQPHNDRPFKCDQCPQSFNRNHDLKRHKRIHLAVKPFPCGHCEKSFSRKDALKRHVLVKGCGKAQASSDGEKQDGSRSTDKKASAGDGRDVKGVKV